MTVAAIIRHKLSAIVVAGEADSFQTIADQLAQNDIGAVVVLGEGGKLSGIISERDLVRAVAKRKEAVFASTARDLMTRKVYVCAPEETEIQIMKYMLEKRIRHMPVVSEGRVVGMVSLADAVRYRLVRIKHLFDEVAQEPDEGRRLGIFTQHLKQRDEPKSNR